MEKRKDWFMIALIATILIIVVLAIASCQTVRGVAGDVGYMTRHVQEQIPAQDSQ